MPAIPTLAYFCCWNRSLATGQRDADDEEDAGLLYFGTKLDFTLFRRARKVGLAQGLVDFTRMLSTPQEKLKAVHSSQQRMLFFEPEEGYFLHAAIDLARLPSKDKSHSRSNSHSSAQSSSAKGTPNDEGLEDEALLAGLRDLYEQFRLLNGSFASIIADAGRDVLSSQLAAYFDDAIWKWQLERVVLGALDFASVLGAVKVSPAHSVIAALPALQALAPQCILLDHDEVLYMPEGRHLAPLTRHLLQKQPKRPKDKPPDESSTKLAPAAPSTASKWTLGLSDYLVSGPKTEKEVQEEKEKVTSTDQTQSRSWLRAVSWSSSKSKTVNEKQEAAPDEDAESDDSSIAEHIARQAADSSSEDAVEDDLLESPETQKGDEVPEAPMTPQPSPFSPPIRVFVDNAWQNVHTLQRGNLLLAMIAEDVPRSQPAFELLMAVEDCLTAHERSPPASPYRHFLHDGAKGLSASHDWPSAEEGWSGSKRSAKEADVMGSLLDFAQSPLVQEALVRTGSGQWAAGRRAPPLESYLVLPRRFGSTDAAEGSLLDAAHELNARLGRAVL